MQMIDVMKRLAELDAQNPNMVEGSGPKEKQHDKYVDRTSPESKAKVQAMKDKMASDKKAEPGKKLAAKIAAKEGVAEGLQECGMMPEMGMSTLPDRPSTPATINMTAGSAAELGDLLKDIVSLAGMKQNEPEMPVAVGAPSVLEPAGDDMGPPEPTSAVDSMRSVIDKLNPADDQPDSDDEQPEADDDKEKVDEYDNEPNPESSGYGSMTPTGDDMHSKGAEAPKVNGGGNPMQKTMEQITRDLFSDYQKFVNEN